MDTVQSFAKKDWSLDIAKFTVTGASKRGWTTWLTGASDSRVAGIVPMVIDTLNMKPQMKLQLASFGDFSEQIKDYVDRDLPRRMNSPAGDVLRAIVDPYSYLERLRLPKLLMMGTNDPYWPLEAASLYWNDLRGEKYLLYVPNNGHGLQDLKRIVGDVLAFQEHVAQGKRFPKLKWNFNRSASSLELAVESDLKPKSVVAWTATANDATSATPNGRRSPRGSRTEPTTSILPFRSRALPPCSERRRSRTGEFRTFSRRTCGSWARTTSRRPRRRPDAEQSHSYSSRCTCTSDDLSAAT